MVFALLPFLLLFFILGFTAVERDLASITPPAAPAEASPTIAAGQVFMTYRNAVMAYAEQLMATGSQYYSGPVSVGSLNLSPALINALPAGAMAEVISNAVTSLSGINGTNSMYGPGYTVCVWMPVPPGTVAQTVARLGGDLTIGTVTSAVSWVQAAPGGPGGPQQIIPYVCTQTQAANGAVPPPTPQAGDMISVVGLGGN